MAKQLYYYDNIAKAVRQVEPITAENTPTLDTIKSYLQNDMGVLAPFSILTVDGNSFLNRLYLGQLDVATITSAEMDGGNF